MYYALVDMRGTCHAMTTLARGSLKDIADMLISECEMLMETTDDMSMEELEDEYYCEFDDYRELAECDNPTFKMIQNFSFTLSDCTIDVGCLVNGYTELVKAFDEYVEDKFTLSEWRLVPEIEETEETLTKLDDELRSLNEDLSREEYQFFIEREAE